MKRRRESYNKCVEENVRNILSKKEGNIIICLGIDGRVTWHAKDQIGIAISKKGIEAIGRKFYPVSVDDEEKYIDVAKSYLSTEDGKSRVFELNGRKYFLYVCYDSFGIRKKGISNFGIDVILDLVHGFGGDYGVGHQFFAKHGFAGASKEWNYPVFGVAVFFILQNLKIGHQEFIGIRVVRVQKNGDTLIILSNRKLKK